MTGLTIDDYFVIRLILLNNPDSMGYETLEASGGGETLESLRKPATLHRCRWI